MLTPQIASQVGRHGVRISCPAPHTILTRAGSAAGVRGVRRQMAAAIPLGRLGIPEDVTLAALLLASQNAAWLTSSITIILTVMMTVWLAR